MKSKYYFNNSLAYEQSRIPMQDKFYREVLGATDIKRFHFNNLDERDIQRQDIDLQFVLDGKVVSISEKHRTKDWGDMFVEMYSKYPYTLGWMHHCNANYFAYFVPNKVYWIDAQALKDFYLTSVRPNISENDIARVMSGKESRQKATVNLGNNSYSLFLVKVPTKDGRDKWEGLGVCLPFSLLKQFKIPIKEFQI